MNQKNRQITISCVFACLSTCFIVVSQLRITHSSNSSNADSLSVHAQEITPANTDLLAILEERQKELRNFQAQFRISIVNIAPGSPSTNSISNSRAYSVCWSKKGQMWRSEISEVYPSEGTQRSVPYFGGYNGELFYTFNGRRQQGMVSGSQKDLLGVRDLFVSLEHPDSDALLITYPSSYVQFLKEGGFTFFLDGQENVNGIPCNLYKSQGEGASGPYRIQIWLASSKSHLTMRTSDEEFVREKGKIVGGSTILCEAEEVIEIKNNFFVVKTAVKELYQFPNNKRALVNRAIVHLESLDNSSDLSNNQFNPHFPPATAVNNLLENPDRLSIVGGQYNDVVSSAKNSIVGDQKLSNGVALSEPSFSTGVKVK